MAIDRIPEFRATLGTLLATYRPPFAQRGTSRDVGVKVFTRVTTRMIYALGGRVGTIDIASIDVIEGYRRTGLLKEVLAAAEAAAAASPTIRGVFIEIVHATEIHAFLQARGYRDADPERVALAHDVSFFKDMHPERGSPLPRG